MNEFDELSIFGICSPTDLLNGNFQVSLQASWGIDHVIPFRSKNFHARLSKSRIAFFRNRRRDLIARDPCEIRKRKDSPGRSMLRSQDTSPQFVSRVICSFSGPHTSLYSNTLSAASRILTIRKDRLQSLTSISILCQDGFLSCGRAIR